METNMTKWMHGELDALHMRQQLRVLEPTTMLAAGWLCRGGRRMLNLASNDYLGYGTAGEEGIEDEMKEAGGTLETQAARASQRFGAAASRLVTGDDPLFSQFEQELAEFQGTESALLLGSGYLANIGVIPALVGRHDTVFSDRLNHASIVDGIVLSRAEHSRYRHRDLNDLEDRLRKASPRARKLIVTDAVFSMDGSLAPLGDLIALKERYGAMLMVDEAHSGGVFGRQGQGLAYEMGLAGRIDVLIGTFSKAYGGYGAYAAGEELLKRYLINHTRSLIYTTALPPALIAAVRRQWQRAKREDWRRTALLRKASWFRQELRLLGLDTGESESHIVPLLLGGNGRALRFAERLQRQGIAAVAIRPPSVPEGTARIRFTLMATHSDADLQWAVDCIAKADE